MYYIPFSILTLVYNEVNYIQYCVYHQHLLSINNGLVTLYYLLSAHSLKCQYDEYI